MNGTRGEFHTRAVGLKNSSLHFSNRSAKKRDEFRDEFFILTTMYKRWLDCKKERGIKDNFGLSSTDYGVERRQRNKKVVMN